MHAWWVFAENYVPNNIHIVVDFDNTDEALLTRITTGACLKVSGQLVESVGSGQKVEVKAELIEILGDSDPEKYPMQPKKHSLEFLRENAHLRMRTQTFGTVFRVRNAIAYAVHKFFQEKGFVYWHSPIITASDAEGAGGRQPPGEDDEAAAFHRLVEFLELVRRIVGIKERCDDRCCRLVRQQGGGQDGGVYRYA